MLVMMIATSFVVYRLMVRPERNEPDSLPARADREHWPPRRLLRREQTP